MLNYVTYDIHKDIARNQYKELRDMLRYANSADERSTSKVLFDATLKLHEAIGLYNGLKSMGCIPAGDNSEEDIKRIKTKIQDILDQRRMKNMIRRH